MPSAPTNIPSPENSDDDDDFSEMHTQKRRSHAQPLVLTMDKLKDYPWERPKYTLRVLIQAAILSSAGNQLVLSDIQDAIAKKYPFYQRTKKWRVCGTSPCMLVLTVPLSLSLSGVHQTRPQS